MGVAIVSGIFAVALAAFSWLLSNGSKRDRLLTRIERQAEILTKLADGHPRRDDLSSSLAGDIAALRALGDPKPLRGRPEIDSWRHRSHRPTSSDVFGLASLVVGAVGFFAAVLQFWFALTGN